MFPGHCSALQPSTTPGPHRLTLHVPLYPTSLTAPPDKVIPATTPCLLPGKKNIWVLEFNSLCLPSPAHHRQRMETESRTLSSIKPAYPRACGAGVMLSMKTRDAFPARNTRQQVNLPELPNTSCYKCPLCLH